MKNIIIAALVGISFLTSGFWIGLRLAPMPKKPAPAAVAKAAPKPVDPKVAFSIDSLKRTSENIATINETLQARERALAAREKSAAQKEDELVAERAALDRLHTHFKQLYSEFEKRLQLVTDDETAALQRQVTIFSTMDINQAVDLIRALDDPTVTRLFVMMEDKSLAKIVSTWKLKYPTETPRLLTDLNGMGRVVAKNKILLPDNAPTDDATPAPPASTDVSTPAGAPAAEANPSPDAAAPAADATTPAAPATDTTTPSPDAASPAAPASDATTPSVTPTDSNNASPAPDAAPTPSNSAPVANPSSASTSGESSSPLDTPGETAAKAATPDHEAAPAPAQFTSPTPTMRLAHEKPARFASARNN